MHEMTGTALTQDEDFSFDENVARCNDELSGGIESVEDPFRATLMESNIIRCTDINETIDMLSLPDSDVWEMCLPDNIQRVSDESGAFSSAKPMMQPFGPTVAFQPKPPDISKGLGQRQEKKDLVRLEGFVTENLKLIVYHGDLCIYEPPCWKKLNERQAEMKIRAMLEQYAQNDCLTQREYQVIWRSLLINPKIQTDKEIFPPERKINFLDGTYDLDSERIFPHSPQDGFFTYINAKFCDIDGCAGDSFEKFVSNLSDGNPDIRKMLLQLIATVILGAQLKHFFVLLGPSNTGKTQFGRFLEELVGHENVEAICDIGDFADRWTTGSLAGKMLATCLDLPNGPLPASAVGIIKQFVGDDPIKGERKYKDPFTFYHKPLLLLAGNHPVRISKISQEQALLNRMVVIPFQNPVADHNMKQHLYHNLVDEAPYIIAQALQEYQELEHNYFQFTRVEIPRELEPQDSRGSNELVRRFFDCRCSVEPGAAVTTSDLFEAYCVYCEENDENPSSQIDFSRCMSTFIASRDEVHPIKRVAGTDQRGYDGLRLNG